MSRVIFLYAHLIIGSSLLFLHITIHLSGRALHIALYLAVLIHQLYQW